MRSRRIWRRLLQVEFLDIPDPIERRTPADEVPALRVWLIQRRAGDGNQEQTWKHKRAAMPQLAAKQRLLADKLNGPVQNEEIHKPAYLR